jgi:hypothetical protein
MVSIRMVKRLLDLNSYKRRKYIRCGILFAVGKTGVTTVIVYEFYRRAPSWEGEDRLIGIFPEREEDPLKITYQSIMNLAKLLIPEKEILDGKIYFISKHI